MPELTLRSFAEMVHMPAYEQSRILHEQKYPRQAPQTFRAPYYAVALAGIRAHYASGNSRAALSVARGKCQGLNPSSKATHNVRVLNAFQASSQAGRSIMLHRGPNLVFPLGNGVDLKLRFDLSGREGKTDWCIFYNCRDATLDKAVAELTLELAAWVLAQQGTQAALPKLQYIDLSSGRVFLGKAPSKKAIRRATANAAIIAALWPSI
jgi:hypothetical protein